MEGSGYHDFFMVIFFRICYCDQLLISHFLLSLVQEPNHITFRNYLSVHIRHFNYPGGMSAILQDAEKYPAADYTVGIAIINVL